MIVNDTINSNGNNVNLNISSTTVANGTITWVIPTLPQNSTIISTYLKGNLTHTMSRGSATTTINGTGYLNTGILNISLGTNLTSSLAVSSVGQNKNSTGTVSISNVVYEVNYSYDNGEIEDFVSGIAMRFTSNGTVYLHKENTMDIFGLSNVVADSETIYIDTSKVLHCKTIIYGEIKNV